MKHPILFFALKRSEMPLDIAERSGAKGVFDKLIRIKFKLIVILSPVRRFKEHAMALMHSVSHTRARFAVSYAQNRDIVNSRVL